MYTSKQAKIQSAHAFAQASRFEECLSACQSILDSFPDDPNMLLDVGGLLLAYGFLSHASNCFERVYRLNATDLRPLVNIANLSREAGNHVASKRLYAHLLERIPQNAIIRRNALVSLEYDPNTSDLERFAAAKSWGTWASTLAAEQLPCSIPVPLKGRPLRVGYVSADFCQHTVGLFIKDVLAAHNKDQVTPFLYSAGHVKDWVTAVIGKCGALREVATLDDVALAKLIRQDAVDVLVDLSGHTAGSRLTVFAHRPAPVQVSWLGYFATTGLSDMDAVFLDAWHAPPGMEQWFTEQIIRLPSGRFCYTPVPFAPEVAPSPHLINGYITFGCFNNTAKLNDNVLTLWADVLKQVPGSRLILKWRTFHDAGLRQTVLTKFQDLGVAPGRLDLRGPSFHADLLREYADIDIALDPFPFTGGLTSCEALWMGVPVVTWPQNRVVSRQTFAFLSAIGLPELAANDATEYVQIAIALAKDNERRCLLREGLRQRMKTSQLCDVEGFTQSLEAVFHKLATVKCARINVATAGDAIMTRDKTSVV